MTEFERRATARQRIAPNPQSKILDKVRVEMPLSHYSLHTGGSVVIGVGVTGSSTEGSRGRTWPVSHHPVARVLTAIYKFLTDQTVRKH